MQLLVKILSADDGESRSVDEQFWHLVEITAGSSGTFCEAEFFGEGEGGCKFKTKEVKRGGITCPSCLERLKWCKSIKL